MSNWHINLESAGKKVLLVVAGIASITLLLFSATVLLGDGIAGNAQTTELAELAKSMSPGNPSAYRSASLLKERSFREEDLKAALEDARQAAFLSPRNYILWQSLARLRERSGDLDGAERTLKVALDLAPNNASLQWAYGNVLLRQEKYDRGFGYIQSAVRRDSRYAGPAASIAWDIFDGDVEKSKKAVGESNPVKAALAGYLSKQKRFDEVNEIWETIPIEIRRKSFDKEASSIVFDMKRANKYRNAVAVASGQAPSKQAAPKVGGITNAGFEFDIQRDKKNEFGWTIEKGELPKIGINLDKKKTGSKSLAIVFEGLARREFRRVAQSVAVVPGETYEFSVFYISRLSGEQTLKWAARNAASKKVIAESEPVESNEEWTALTFSFEAPEDVDGVEIVLMEERCEEKACPKKGIIWFDDFSIKQQ